MLFVDGYSRMMTVLFLKQKSDAFQMFKWYLARVEKEIGKILKCIISDRGGLFTTRYFEVFCNDRGIKRKTSAPRTPPQNGIVERRNTSVNNYAKTLMMEKNVALDYYREAVSTIVYTLIEFKSRKVLMQHLLNYGMVTHLMLNISKYLDVSAIFLKILGMENLMPKVMKAYSLDTPLKAKLISV